MVPGTILLSTAATAAATAAASLAALLRAAHNEWAAGGGLLSGIAFADDQDFVSIVDAAGDLGLIAVFEADLHDARQGLAVRSGDHHLAFSGRRRLNGRFGQEDHVFLFIGD